MDNKSQLKFQEDFQFQLTIVYCSCLLIFHYLLILNFIIWKIFCPI